MGLIIQWAPAGVDKLALKNKNKERNKVQETRVFVNQEHAGTHPLDEKCSTVCLNLFCREHVSPHCNDLKGFKANILFTHKLVTWPACIFNASERLLGLHCRTETRETLSNLIYCRFSSVLKKQHSHYHWRCGGELFNKEVKTRTSEAMNSCNRSLCFNQRYPNLIFGSLPAYVSISVKKTNKNNVYILFWFISLQCLQAHFCAVTNWGFHHVTTLRICKQNNNVVILRVWRSTQSLWAVWWQQQSFLQQDAFN